MSKSERKWEVPGKVAANGTNGGRESFFTRMLRKVFPDQREQARLPEPPLMGYLGTAQGSRPFEVGDVSMGGFKLVTEERWLPGTEMPVTLKRTNVGEGETGDQFTVQATAVRWTEDGVAFSIVLFEEESRAVSDNPLQVNWASRQEMKLFLERMKDPEEMKAETRETQNDADASLRAALNARFHVSPHTAGD